MRVYVLLLFVLMAGPCYADDVLETLNTVEDTLQTMEHALQGQDAEEGGNQAPAPTVSDEAGEPTSAN